MSLSDGEQPLDTEFFFSRGAWFGVYEHAIVLGGV